MTTLRIPRLFPFFMNRSNAPVLERDPPKEVPPTPREFGHYCVKATVFLEDEQKGKVFAKITGKSTDWDIIPQTVHACATIKNGRVRKGMCSDPQVSVVAYDQECNDQIDIEIH